MQPATTGAFANAMKVVIGNDPERWARITVSMIVEAGTEATLETRADIAKLRTRLLAILLPVFERVGSYFVRDETMESLANDCLLRIVETGKATRWKDSFSEGTIQQAIKDLIARNLLSASGGR